MSINERIYQIDQLLNGRKFVTFEELLERLEISRATLKRDLAYMRDRLNAPIIFDREVGGYRLEKQSGNLKYELPGLWFNADEIFALLTMQHLLNGLDSGGILTPHIKPLKSRLTELLGSTNDPLDQLQKRIKIETMGSRKFNLDHFQAIGSSLLKRKQLHIDYLGRGKNELTSRDISPQRLIYYKDNWYLDGWCHLKEDIRSFSVDAIQRVEILETKAKDVSEEKLNEELGSGYGIFSGKDVKWVTLKFSPERARWVSKEKWHPKQEGQFLDDGSYQLKIPYSKEPELLIDVMKYGPDVEVTAPEDLRKKIQATLIKTLEKYENR
ncbi:COG2378 Predicted transcriptional regulator [Candidatus Methylopumilus universalis]|uniref:helix-turn-helix transcriptional regulator n=1 Tax=Candidatus Methylopumilus universalis TaxID=2588536 RepID=UPI003BEF0AD4